MKKYDLIIIGGGSGGLAAALHAEQFKAKTLLVNAGLPLGGTCLHVGCIPSKRYIYIAQLIARAKKSNFAGFTCAIATLNFKKIVQETNKLIQDMSRNNYKIIKELKYIDHIEGFARFVRPNVILVKNSSYRADKFIIATGSTAIIPPIEGVEKIKFLTHVEALNLQTIPPSVIIVGAGAIGMEFAQLFARFGSKVFVLEQSDAIHAHSDTMLTDHLADLFQKEKINIETSTKVIEVNKKKNKKIVKAQRKNHIKIFEAHELIFAVGKKPNTQKLGLENANVITNEKGAIIVNNFMQTNQQDIYAIGDVIQAPLRIETTAAQEGKIAVNNSFSTTKESINYQEIPFCLFTDPELAKVGLMEEEILDRSDYAIWTASLADLPKAKITKQYDGLIKLIIAKKNRQIKGIHLLCPGAGDIIGQAVIMIKNKQSVDDVLNSIYAYPTFSEAIKWLIRSYHHTLG